MKRFTTLIFIALMGITLWGQTQVPRSDPNGPIYYKNGKVGIGINNPLSKLHINNGDNSYGAILAQAKESNFQLYTKTLTTQPTNVKSLRIGLKYSNDENNGFISFYRGKNTYGGFLGFSTNGKERIRITSNGNIGISTPTPSPKVKFDVAGTIRAIEIKVDAQTADFVFEDNYPLRTLDEVEAFIKTRGHLPSIPSAESMEKNGINLSEMNKLLLQKIEEMTLHAIKMEKRNKENEEKLKQMNVLNERLTKIEELL